MRTGQSDSQRGNLCLLLPDDFKETDESALLSALGNFHQYLGNCLRCSTIAVKFQMIRVCS